MTIFPLGWLYFHSEGTILFTRMTIFPLGRHYLIQSASFRPDGNLFTRNIFTWTTISLGWLYFHLDNNKFIRSANFHSTVEFHSTVNFHSDGKLFTRISDWKHSPILICLSRPHMISDWDELYTKIDRLDETKLFHVEGFSIQGCIDGRITRATYQTSVWHLAPYFRWGSVCSILPLTFAYELGLRWFIYQNRSARRDETFSCWRFFDSRPSWWSNYSRNLSDKCLAPHAIFPLRFGL